MILQVMMTIGEKLCFWSAAGFTLVGLLDVVIGLTTSILYINHTQV